MSDEFPSVYHAIARVITQYETMPLREGLERTPERVAAAYDEMLSGYLVLHPENLLTSFADGSPSSANELVIVSGIRFYSMCEHHLVPFFGIAHVGYLPKTKIVGLSKLARIVEVYARRMQVQERLTNEIADLLYDNLDTEAVGVVLHARHLCMEVRGVRQPGTVTTTSALRGQMKLDTQLRAEFFNLIPHSEKVTI